MSFQQPSTRAVRGFTLTEAAIVLGIVGLILSAIWVAAGSVYNNYRSGKTQDQLLTMVQAMRSLHASQTKVDGTAFSGTDGSKNLALAGGVPSDMIQYTTAGVPEKVLNVWGGAVSIDAEPDENTNPDQAFQITYENVPYSTCITLLTSMTGSGRDSGLIKAKGIAGSDEVTFPILPNQIVKDCGTVSGTISFTFRLRA